MHWVLQRLTASQYPRGAWENECPLSSPTHEPQRPMHWVKRAMNRPRMHNKHRSGLRAWMQ